jgi:hypothetical protein
MCDKHETACIFDRYTGVCEFLAKIWTNKNVFSTRKVSDKGSGLILKLTPSLMFQKLSFKVMRNKGSKECEDWQVLVFEQE